MNKLKYRRQITKTSSEITSTKISILSDATLDPDVAQEQPSTANWFSPDSTSAPEIVVVREPPESYAKTQWGLIEKYILKREVLPFALVIFFIGWIIIQDNKAGKLANWGGMWWTIQKCGVVLGIFFVLLALGWLYHKITK